MANVGESRKVWKAAEPTCTPFTITGVSSDTHSHAHCHCHIG